MKLTTAQHDHCNNFIKGAAGIITSFIITPNETIATRFST